MSFWSALHDAGMMEPKMIERKFQVVGQRKLDRTHHVWKKESSGQYKCVLCGGLTRNPTDEELPESYENLTREERDSCPLILPAGR